jgi:hypothetical protein
MLLYKKRDSSISMPWKMAERQQRLTASIFRADDRRSGFLQKVFIQQTTRRRIPSNVIKTVKLSWRHKGEQRYSFNYPDPRHQKWWLTARSGRINPRKNPDTHRRLGGPQSRYARFGEKTTLSSLPGFEPGQSSIKFPIQLISLCYQIKLFLFYMLTRIHKPPVGARDGAVSRGTLLEIRISRVRFPMEFLAFLLTLSSRSHYGLRVDSTNNRNEYQGHLQGGKGNLGLHVPIVVEILGASSSSNPNGLSWLHLITQQSHFISS